VMNGLWTLWAKGRAVDNGFMAKCQSKGVTEFVDSWQVSIKGGHSTFVDVISDEREAMSASRGVASASFPAWAGPTVGGDT